MLRRDLLGKNHRARLIRTLRLVDVSAYKTEVDFPGALRQNLYRVLIKIFWNAHLVKV